MADCSNVEMRELLPERAGSALSVADTARVDSHLASCALCASELALIQSARRVLRVTPMIDVARVTSGVIAATAAPSRPQLVTSGGHATPMRRHSRMRWVGWKAAAAIAIAAAGAGSFAVWTSANESASVPNGTPASATAAPKPRNGAPFIAASAAATRAGDGELGVAGGLSDLSDGDLQALLGDLGASAPAMVADDSFEEPDVIVPSVANEVAWEST